MILNIKQFDVNRYGKYTKINRVVDRVAILKRHKAMLWLCQEIRFKVGLIGYLLQLLKKHILLFSVFIRMFQTIQRLCIAIPYIPSPERTSSAEGYPG